MPWSAEAWKDCTPSWYQLPLGMFLFQTGPSVQQKQVRLSEIEGRGTKGC